MFPHIKKLLVRAVYNPRKIGLSDASVILDRNFGSGRGTPIDRKLIERFLIEELKFTHKKGKVLEFAERTYSRELVPELTSYEFIYIEGKILELDERNKILKVDLMLPSPSSEGFFDLVIPTQLLAFTSNPFIVAQNLVTMLKQGGRIIGTEPFCSPISDYDNSRWGDYFRFTRKGIEALFKGISGLSVETQALGNWFTSLALYKGLSVEDNLELLNQPDDNYATNIGYTVEKHSRR